MASLVSHLSHLSALMPYIEALYVREKIDPNTKASELEKFCVKEFSIQAASMMYSHMVEIVNLIPDENRDEFNKLRAECVAHMKDGEKVYKDLEESLAAINLPPEAVDLLRKVFLATRNARG